MRSPRAQHHIRDRVESRHAELLDEVFPERHVYFGERVVVAHYYQGVEDDVNGESRERRYHLVFLHSEHPAYLYEDILQFFYRICHAMLFLVLSFWCIVVLSERCIVALSERFIESLVGKVEHCDVAAAVAKRRKEVALAVGMQGEYPSHLLLAAAVGR